MQGGQGTGHGLQSSSSSAESTQHSTHLVGLEQFPRPWFEGLEELELWCLRSEGGALQAVWAAAPSKGLVCLSFSTCSPWALAKREESISGLDGKALVCVKGMPNATSKGSKMSKTQP